MPKFAQFVALTAATTSITLPTAGDRDIEFNFDLEDLDDQRTVIVMFKVQSALFASTAQPRLEMIVNGSSEVDLLFASPTYSQPRTWHEVVDKEVFMAADNVLKFVGPAASSSASVTLTDIVVLYHGES